MATGPAWWGDRQPWDIPAREFLEHYLAAIQDPDQRLAYLQALETRMRQDGSQEWVEAIAAHRLEKQLA